MQWYYSKNSTQLGPVSQEELMEKVTSGEILSSDLVWKEGMRDWQPVVEIPGLSALTAQSPTDYVTPSAPVSRPTELEVLQPQPPPTAYEFNNPAPTSGLAIASLICGVVGVICLMTCIFTIFSPIFGIPAVICGHLALHQISNAPQPVPGRGLAIAGLVTGYVSMLVVAAFFVFAVFFMVEGSSTTFY